MYCMTAPETGGSSCFSQASRRKHEPRRSILVDAEESVLNMYKDYEAAAPLLEDLDPHAITEELSEAMLNCYDSHTRPVSTLVKEIHDAGDDVGCCPYCQIAPPSTIDHYLPRENHYPEFSVFGPNLIPSCGRCNTLKGERYRNASRERLHFHPYYDDISGHTVLQCQVYFRNGMPSLQFCVFNGGKVSKYVFEIVQRHFQSLQLAKRYVNVATPELSKYTKALRNHLNNGWSVESLQDHLSTLAHDELHMRGENHWRVVLLAALDGNKEYIEWLQVFEG